MNCPLCAGQGVVLGQLGQTVWLRCRQCGWDYTSEPLHCPECGAVYSIGFEINGVDHCVDCAYAVCP